MEKFRSRCFFHRLYFSFLVELFFDTQSKKVEKERKKEREIEREKEGE